METMEKTAGSGQEKKDHRREGKTEGSGNSGGNTALYIRLSREDGDKAESLSVGNQRMLLKEFVSKQSGLEIYDIYIDV